MFYKVVMYKGYDGKMTMGAMPYGSLSDLEDKGYHIDPDAASKPVSKESK